MTRSLSITRAQLECFCSSFQATKRRCETLHQKVRSPPPKNTLHDSRQSRTLLQFTRVRVYTCHNTEIFCQQRYTKLSAGRWTAPRAPPMFSRAPALVQNNGQGKKTKRPLSPRLPGTSVYTCSAGSDRAHLAADLHRRHRRTNKQEGHRHLEGEPALIIQARRRIFTEQRQRDKPSKCQKTFK